MYYHVLVRPRKNLSHNACKKDNWDINNQTKQTDLQRREFKLLNIEPETGNLAIIMNEKAVFINGYN